MMVPAGTKPSRAAFLRPWSFAGQTARITVRTPSPASTSLSRAPLAEATPRRRNAGSVASGGLLRLRSASGSVRRGSRCARRRGRSTEPTRCASACRAAKQRAPRGTVPRGLAGQDRRAPRDALLPRPVRGTRARAGCRPPAAASESRDRARGAPGGGEPWRRARALDERGNPAWDGPAQWGCTAVVPPRARARTAANWPVSGTGRRHAGALRAEEARRAEVGDTDGEARDVCDHGRPGRPRTPRARRRREARPGSAYGRRGTGRGRCAAGARVGCGCAAR